MTESDRVVTTASVQITRGSEPVARIVPEDSAVREVGFAEGTFVVPDDFDDIDPELEPSFYAG